MSSCRRHIRQSIHERILILGCLIVVIDKLVVVGSLLVGAEPIFDIWRKFSFRYRVIHSHHHWLFMFFLFNSVQTTHAFLLKHRTLSMTHYAFNTFYTLYTNLWSERTLAFFLVTSFLLMAILTLHVDNIICLFQLVEYQLSSLLVC